MTEIVSRSERIERTVTWHVLADKSMDIRLPYRKTETYFRPHSVSLTINGLVDETERHIEVRVTGNVVKKNGETVQDADSINFHGRRALNDMPEWLRELIDGEMP